VLLEHVLKLLGKKVGETEFFKPIRRPEKK